MGTGGSSRRVRAALGGETARSGARYRPFEVSPPQCLPASACRYAWIPAGGAIAVVGDGRWPSPAALAGTPGRSAAAVGSARGVSDRAAAPGRASASWAQPAAAAGSDVARKGPLVELGAPSALDEGAPVDVRGPRGGAGLPEGRWIPPRHGVRTRSLSEYSDRLLRLRERHPFVVQVQQPRLGARVSHRAGPVVPAVGLQVPRLAVVGEIEMQVFGHPRLQVGRRHGECDFDPPE